MSRRHTDHFDTVTLQGYTDAQIAFIASVEHDYDDDPVLASIIDDYPEHFSSDDEFDEEVVALAHHLDVTPAPIEPGWREQVFTVDGQDWLVLDDESAEEEARASYEESLWAFHADFLVEYMPANIPIEAIRALQEALYEDASPVLAAMLGNDRLDDLLDDANATDGRGLVLSSWNGEEVELPLEVRSGRTVMYYGYRV